MFNLGEIMNMIEKFQEGLKNNLCELKLLSKFMTLEHGQLPQDFVARSADKLQFVEEKTVTTNTTVKVRKDAGYYPRDGYVANLGDESFKVILIGLKGQKTDIFTITPNTSYAIRSPIEEIQILPQETLSAFYQVSLI